MTNSDCQTFKSFVLFMLPEFL